MGPLAACGRRASLLALFAVCLACAAGETATTRPNLLLVLIDTLRADHVGAYGYERDTTPVIDELARGGLRFEFAMSQASSTLPSLMSLFTSRHPPDVAASGVERGPGMALAAAETTLAERLRAAGYATASVATNPYTYDRIFGLMQGFDEQAFALSAPASWVVDRALEQIDAFLAAPSGRPFFLYLHLMDVHAPYAPPAPFDRLFYDTAGALEEPADRETVNEAGTALPDATATPAGRRETIARYDGALRFADAQIGRLLEQLADRGLRDTTVIVIASDHGEDFWDRVALERRLDLHSHGQPGRYGVGHGHTVFRELVSVPLILNGPGIRPGVAPGPVRNLDLAPTLLRLAGVTADASEWQGVDLLDRDRVRSLLALSEAGGRTRSQRALVSGRHQIVRIHDAELFFDVTRPRWPQVEPLPRVRDELGRDLDAELARVRRVRAGVARFDAETEAALRSLGYLH